MDSINMVFITDDNFAILTGIAIYSLKKHANKNYLYNINIICNNVNDNYILRFKNLRSKKFKVNIIKVDGKKYEKLKKDNLHVSTTAIFKFDLPNIFPNLDKILYIDGDVLIQSDLINLYNEDISKNYAGVVIDFNGLTYPSEFKARLKVKNKYYFNSGMLLLNLKKLREDNVAQKLIKYRLYKNNFYMDQDAFNVVFKDNVKYLSLNYNFVITCWRNFDEDVFVDFFGLKKQEKKIDYLKNADIVHFASADKPSKYIDVPMASDWFKYFKSSSFKDIELERKYLKKINPSHVYFTNSELLTEDTLKSDNPSVSIIIPSYNARQYIYRTIKSVTTQSLKNIEIICVDDGSTDGTYERLKELALYDNRIKLFKQQNQYAGVARNNGIQKALGDYIVFLDSDDQLKENALMKMYKKAISTDADIVITKAFSLDDKTKKVSIDGAGFSLNEKFLPGKDVFNGDDIPKYIFNITGGNPWAKMFKRSFIISNQIKFLPIKRSEDFYFVIIALAYASRITCVKERLLYYRINNSKSLESTKDETPLLFWEANMCLYNYLKEHNLFEKYKQSFLNNSLDKIIINFKNVNSVISLEKILYLLKENAETFFDFYNHKGEYWHSKSNYDFAKYLLSIPNITKYFNDILEENRRLKAQLKKESNNLKERSKKIKTPFKQKLKLIKKRGIRYCIIRLFAGRKAGDKYLTKKGLW